MMTIGSNWLPTDAAPPCAGQWLVFDSTDPQDHLAAKRLCAGCEFRIKCASVADGERARQGRPVGTWGGKVYGRDGRSAAQLSDAQWAAYDWTHDEALSARRARENGDTSEWAKYGSRAYDRIRRRRLRERRAAA